MANENSAMPVVLTIAGFDPSCGAGVAADLKTFHAHHCYGIAAITALTVQNIASVKTVEPVKAKFLKETLDALAEEVTPAAIKIGMLATAENVRVVAAWLERFPKVPVVLDPVTHATSGPSLLEENGIKEMKQRLFKLATVLTPNLSEAALLTGLPVTTVEEMKLAAKELLATGARAVLITGGHLGKPIDVLFEGGDFILMPSDRVKSERTHGTGCAHAAALAALLAHGRELSEAAVLAKAYVKRAIEKGLALGKGGVPDHLYRFHETAPPRAGGSAPHHLQREDH